MSKYAGDKCARLVSSLPCLCYFLIDHQSPRKQIRYDTKQTAPAPMLLSNIRLLTPSTTIMLNLKLLFHEQKCIYDVNDAFLLTEIKVVKW